MVDNSTLGSKIESRKLTEASAKHWPLVNSLRFSAFFSISVPIENKWWEEVTECSPDSTTTHLKSGVQITEGQFKDENIEGKLILMVHPTRIDWQLFPLNNITIGEMEDSLNSFLALIRRWITISPPVQRIAFGALLNTPLKSKKEICEWIAFYLPKIDLDEESSEFAFQINRPRISTRISDLYINRLSKWRVDTSFVVDLLNSTQFLEPQHPEPQLSAKLELDISTVPSGSIKFSSEEYSKVFEELVELGKEIVIKGDIK